MRLARFAAAALTEAGHPTRAQRLLTPVRALGDQSGLGAQARADNLAGAFGVRRDLPPELVVVVVDDVVTTGASLVEATRALTAAGAHVRGAATVAATVRRSSRSAITPHGYRRTPVQ
jgi:predicted amidophosphoribosyltransferase